ncbi:interferon-stimulated 20 kDa exonuclease-like 2 [Protopterus annectens]|uniref:interferon-stimulated 20 kDa exonuclease-like 2 n=1 Tax=Protopterus annectens TaxID=7888 RepID=UPI001CFC42A2|nr:interferon-stimulated 20 kDa exonuclease-like 2 [Protopterus annectens]XP_043935741.1 interferon-stimulated 20 kDa exonuclease-like 2 [Protopterus annectens]
MSEIVLNVDFAASGSQHKPSGPSNKHERFIKKRRYLEKKGFLKEKQLAHLGNRQLGKPTGNWNFGKNSLVEGDFGHLQKPRDHIHQGYANIPKFANFKLQNAQQHGFRPQSFGKVSVKTSLINPSFSPGTQSQAYAGQKDSLLSEYESGLSAAATSGKSYKYVAIDCEMVGTGPNGNRSELARCSIVGYHGDLVYDQYILPVNPVTNYRTRWSGIRKHHLKNATPFRTARKEILKILTGKIVVGHAIHNDFKALSYFHTEALTRDTSKIPLLNKKAGFPEKESASLKRLVKQLLKKDIQVGKSGHSSVEDAKATMELYRMIEAEWEKELASIPDSK